MKKKDFLEFYDKVIERYIEEIISYDKSSNANCLKFRKKRVMKIYNYYEKKRSQIRSRFMNSESQPLDRHKIASVIIYAIIKAHVFSVNKLVSNLPKALLMANEYLAFNVALNIVEMYRRDEDGTSDFLIVLPRTYHSVNDSYFDNVCKALYLIPAPRRFDIFAYANMLFILERYSKDCMVEVEA